MRPQTADIHSLNSYEPTQEQAQKHHAFTTPIER